jgi:two-component system sensor histidine kinase YesM
MILIFFMIIIVPFLLFAYYAHIKSIEGISNANMSMTNSYLLQARKNFEIYLNGLNDQVNDLIGNKELQDLLGGRQGTADNDDNDDAFTVNLLTLLYQRVPSIDAYRVRVYPIDPSRFPDYMSTIGEPSAEREAWFRQSKANVSPQWYLTMPRKGKLDRPVLTYVKRFSGLYDQIPRGLIATDVSEDQLKRFFSPSGEMIEQRLILMDNTGQVLYDSTENRWTGLEFPSDRFIRHFRSGNEGSLTITLEGGKYLASYVGMTSQPWTIVSLTPLDNLTGTTEEVNRVFVWSLIAYLVCCVGVALYITVYFTQPIARLVRLMRKAEPGSFRRQIPLSARQDEVGWLYRGFNSLIHRVEELIAETSRAERRKKELEFQVLSHQINPHFLYNTLDSIRWKAENLGSSEIAEMVAALGNLLRLSLNQGKEITTLGREIEQVKAYVRIEQARLGKPIRILYSLDDELKDAPFLRLLLQPLVENAIQHSIRDNFEDGKILLTARKEGSDMIIDIIDNGSGIPPEALARLNLDADDAQVGPAGSKGVGLRNVNNRLKLYFGERHRLRIETGPGLGTRITLLHPLLPDDKTERPG